MPIKNFYFRIAEGDNGVVKVEYDDELKKILSWANAGPADVIQTGSTTTYKYYANEIPAFLDTHRKTSEVQVNYADLYLQQDGDVLYRVQKINAHPWARVISAFYKPLAYTADIQNVSQYGYSDGSFTITLKDGSGYVHRVSDSPGTVAFSLSQAPNLQAITMRAGSYQRSYRDALTGEILEIPIEITEPACLLLIDEIQVTPESAPDANDGQITVVIADTSTNAVEYKLNQSGIWQDSNVFSGLANGSYTLYAREKDQNLCAQEKPVAVEALPCDLVIDRVDVLHESFIGNNDGRITILASSARDIEYALGNGAGEYTPFQESNIFYNLSPGTGTNAYVAVARLRAANSCRTQQIVDVESGDHFTAQVTNIVCGGSATGRINVVLETTAAKHAPYTYLWEDGFTEANRTKLRAGNYTVTITNGKGISKQITAEITENPPIVITAEIGGLDVYLSVSGGVAPYTFKWSDGATAQNRTNLPPDNYLVTVTDSTGCKKTENILVRIPQHYFSENMIALEVQAIDLDLKPSFTFVCEVWIEPEYLSDNFIKVAEIEQPVDADGKSVFQVEEYLNAYLQPSLPVIEEGIRRLDNNFKRFYLKYTEKYGLPAELSDFSQQETFYVLLGGLSFEEYSTKDFFMKYVPEQKPFYTWQPQEKEVFPEQPEFLYYTVHDKNLTGFQVHMKLYYPAVSTGEDIVEEHQLFIQSGVKQYEIYTFPAGYDQLSIAGYSCDACYRYDIFVTDSNGVLISEIRTYWVNHEYYQHKRFFFFLNSLGGFDTLSATGRIVHELKTQEEKAQKLLPYNYRPTDRTTETVSKYGEPEINVPVGYPSPEMMQRLQDFVISKEYYLYEDNRLIPVEIDIRKATILDEDENLNELEFTYMPPKMNKFTPLLANGRGATGSPGDELMANAYPSPATTESSNGSITLEVSGGFTPYSFLWSDGATTQNRNDLAAGSYSVRVLDNSVPKLAVSVCNILVESIPDTSVADALVANYNMFTSDNNMFYESAPGFKYVFPSQDLAGTSAEIHYYKFQRRSFLPGTYRLSLYIYLPSAYYFSAASYLGYDNTKISIYDTNIIGNSITLEQVASVNIKDQWQHIQTVFTIDTQDETSFDLTLYDNHIHRMDENGNYYFDMKYTADWTYFISDLKLEKIS